MNQNPCEGGDVELNRVVVIGASAGGIAALSALFGQLEADFPVPILAVLHIDAHRSNLPQLFASRSRLDVSYANDGEMMHPGRIYFAPPDHHLLIEQGVMRLSRAPKENYCRPAIDPLFRSAAIERGRGVIGIVMTGMLNDGTAGLQDIKDCGGIAIVQHPDDATEPSMPQSALRYVDVDHCTTVDAMAVLLEGLITRVPSEPTHFRDQQEIQTEHRVHRGQGNTLAELDRIGARAAIVCPECGGTLWRLMTNGMAKFRCHTGHAYSMQSLEHEQARLSEESLTAAMRAMQERVVLLTEYIALLRLQGDEAKAAQTSADLRCIEENGVTLRHMLEQLPGSAAQY